MFVEQVYLSNFRNYEIGNIKFKDGTNVIYGANARGKTNILESIYIMSTGRSHRGSKEAEMIRFGQDSAKIAVKFYSHSRENKAEIDFFNDKKKRIKINGVVADKTSQLMGYLNTVIFCPEDLKLVKGSPGVRRKMLDFGICQLRQKYFHSLSSYYKILEQRNKLLKDDPESEMLWIWDEKLVECGTDIIWYRNSFIERLNEKIKKIIKEICDETIDLVYDCGFKAENLKDKESTKKSFEEELQRNIPREKKLGMSLVGPHRDDFKIILNDKEAKFYASQGQQRTIALAIKMAEVELIKDDKEETPVLLLDDVLSELDVNRREYVLNKIKTIQVIITCTEKDLFGNIPDVNLIDVEDIKNKIN